MVQGVDYAVENITEVYHHCHPLASLKESVKQQEWWFGKYNLHHITTRNKTPTPSVDSVQ